MNRPAKIIGRSTQVLPNNWKLYFENTKDTYHASILHAFLTTFRINRLSQAGGINIDNAPIYLDAGASHVIVTSWVFREGQLDFDRLRTLVSAVGKNRLVLDLSCRRKENQYWVVTDRWQKFTEFTINRKNLERLAVWCDEFLIHAADVEGLCGGVDLELVNLLAKDSPIPTTYAGGARSLADEARRVRRAAHAVEVGAGVGAADHHQRVVPRLGPHLPRLQVAVGRQRPHPRTRQRKRERPRQHNCDQTPQRR
jgi:phosphoribosylformimino-5-aminoimidazole carboxamide ribotide isomerase